LYAGRDFAGGDVTLATSAVAWVFFGPKDRAFLEARCAFCGATKAETLCDKCENAYFCESCRDGRPHVCEARASPSLRLAAMAARTCDEAYLRRNASRKTLDPFAVAAVRRLLSAAADGDDDDSSESLAEASLRKLQRYGHALTDDELRVIGIGLFPAEATAANHSCSPNVWPRFAFRSGAAPTMEYVATVATIRKGDELCHEYVDQALPAKERRESLLKDYGFLCACSERCFACVHFPSDESRTHAFLTARDAAEDAIQGRDMHAASKALSAMSEGLEAAYHGDYHPLKALHYLRLAKVQFSLNEKALPLLDNLKVALARLPKTHGPDSPLIKIADHLREETIRLAWSSEYSERHPHLNHEPEWYNTFDFQRKKNRGKKTTSSKKKKGGDPPEIVETPWAGPRREESATD